MLKRWTKILLNQNKRKQTQKPFAHFHRVSFKKTKNTPQDYLKRLDMARF